MITQSRKRSALWELIIYSVVGACVVYTVTMAAFTVADRVKAAAALHCARASDGADSSIADCYNSRGLPVPEDL